MSVSLQRGYKNKKISFFKKVSKNTDFGSQIWCVLEVFGLTWATLGLTFAHVFAQLRSNTIFDEIWCPRPPQNGSRRQGRCTSAVMVKLQSNPLATLSCGFRHALRFAKRLRLYKATEKAGLCTSLGPKIVVISSSPGISRVGKLGIAKRSRGSPFPKDLTSLPLI